MSPSRWGAIDKDNGTRTGGALTPARESKNHIEVVVLCRDVSAARQDYVRHGAACECIYEILRKEAPGSPPPLNRSQAGPRVFLEGRKCTIPPGEGPLPRGGRTRPAAPRTRSTASSRHKARSPSEGSPQDLAQATGDII